MFSYIINKLKGFKHPYYEIFLENRIESLKKENERDAKLDKMIAKWEQNDDVD